MDITLITGNKNKLREAEEILGIKLNSRDIDLDEIQELDPIKILEHKIMQGWEIIREPLFVWDQSVYIDCLNGFPGPLIKWFWDQVILGKISAIANSFDNHKISTETALAYFNGQEIKIFTARLEGTIPDKPRGDKGWGWDPIFIPEGFDMTYGEFDPEEVIKHRTHRIVLEELREYLKKRSA